MTIVEVVFLLYMYNIINIFAHFNKSLINYSVFIV